MLKGLDAIYEHYWNIESEFCQQVEVAVDVYFFKCKSLSTAGSLNN